MASSQFKAVKATLPGLFDKDIALFTIFRAGGSLPNAFRQWVTAKLRGYSTMFTVVDAYGFAAGPDAALALIDLRTMKIVEDQLDSVEELIAKCEALE